MNDLDAERVFVRVLQSMLGEDVSAPAIAKYELRDKLGSGATGDVYGAWDRENEREVAMKVLREPSDQASVRRLRREALALRQLAHPNVLRIHDVGEADGLFFIAMERLEGETLQERLARDGAITPLDTLPIVKAICSGIGEAHRHDIVHRDLKPANVFLATTGVKVLDFGVAKALGIGTLGASTATGTLLGTPHYMSPEQIVDAKRIDHRCDLWAVAVIAYECLVGQRPFEAASVAELSVAIVTGDPPIPSRHAAVPTGFDAWFSRAVARDPAARFQSADELADALEAALEGRPQRTKASRAERIAVLVIVAVVVSTALVLAGAFGPPTPAGPPRATTSTPSPAESSEHTAPQAPAREPSPAPPEAAKSDSPPQARPPRTRPKPRANVDDLEF